MTCVPGISIIGGCPNRCWSCIRSSVSSWAWLAYWIRIQDTGIAPLWSMCIMRDFLISQTLPGCFWHVTVDTRDAAGSGVPGLGRILMHWRNWLNHKHRKTFGAMIPCRPTMPTVTHASTKKKPTCFTSGFYSIIGRWRKLHQDVLWSMPITNCYRLLI